MNILNTSIAGKTFLITRSTDQISEIRDLLEPKGAKILIQPAIAITQREVSGNAADFANFNSIIFSSSNGVHCFFGQNLNCNSEYEKTIFNLSRSGRLKIIAVGPGTAKALAEYGLTAEIPETYCAEGILELLKKDPVRGNRFLLVRGSRGRDFLLSELIRLGGEPKEWVVYESKDVESADPDIVQALENGEIDGITITSSAIARSAVRLFGKALNRTALFSISPRTSETLSQAGYPPAGEAEEATLPSLIELMKRYFTTAKS